MNHSFAINSFPAVHTAAAHHFIILSFCGQHENKSSIITSYGNIGNKIPKRGLHETTSIQASRKRELWHPQIRPGTEASSCWK
jgi:hypothetical protein